ncbi:MAG: VWA domain-containing protein [Spirochaetes bacterium]|nr:VWA domain-containing protein [Spirochaetota bacterium]
MKRNIIIILLIIIPFILSGESLNLTHIDTALYSVNDQIALYFSLLDDQGKPISDLDHSLIKLSETDLLRDQTYTIDQFEIFQTDKMMKSGNFIFLVDNSLSMYWLVLPEYKKSEFQGLLKGISSAGERNFVKKFYQLKKDTYIPIAYITEQNKIKIAEIIKKHHNIKIKNRMELVSEALQLFIRSMPDNLDAKGLVSFNEETFFHTNYTQKHNDILDGLTQINMPDENTGWTELYQALSDSNHSLADKGGRKFLILLSDGYQRSNDPVDKTPLLEDAIKTALDNNIVIFTIGLGNDVDLGLLKSLAAQTGGYHFNGFNKDSLEQAYQYISNIIFSEYKLVYKGNNLLSENRKIYLEYKNLTSERTFLISSIYGKPLHPFAYLLLLFILVSLIFLMIICLITRKKVTQTGFIGLDSNTRVLMDSDTVYLDKEDKSIATTRVIKKNDTYILEGDKTRVNNNEISGTRILNPGDVITTKEGTKLIFTGAFDLSTTKAIDNTQSKKTNKTTKKTTPKPKNSKDPKNLPKKKK